MSEGHAPPFLRRHGYRSPDREITVREDAPEELRYAVLQIAKDLGLTPHTLRAILCGVLHRRPLTQLNWSPGNVWQEVYDLIEDCVWFKVYDIIEAIYRYLLTEDLREVVVAPDFEARINDFFREQGIGWQLMDGQIQVRGTEAFEAMLRAATDALGRAGLPTEKNELHQAIQDLSRRPDPDATGPIPHAAAALECVARQASGDQQATLGKIMNDHPNLVPQPLNKAVAQICGYTSEMGRHLQEGRATDFAEAELVVGLSAALATYLAKKLNAQGKGLPWAF